MIYNNDVYSWKEWLKLKKKGYTEVGGYFYCHESELTSLKGAPKKVEGDFYCSYNELTTLEGAPEEVGGWFDCSGNKLKTLDGAPEKIRTFFSDIVRPNDWEEYYLTHFKDKKWSEEEIPFEEMDKVNQTKLLAKRLGGK